VGKDILQQAELGSQEIQAVIQTVIQTEIQTVIQTLIHTVIQRVIPSYGQSSSLNNAMVYYNSSSEITIRSYYFIIKTCRLA